MATTYTAAATVAPGASVTKGLYQLTTASTTPIRVCSLDISMDGGASSFWPQFKLLRAAGSFTAATGGNALTAQSANEAGSLVAAQTTPKFGTFSAELAVGSGTLVTLTQWYLPNSSGLFYQWPLGRELAVPVSACLSLQVITPASFANNINITCMWEE